MTSLAMHIPVVVSDGGPWAFHDVACPVCRSSKAILNLNTNVFEPCSACQIIGWRTVKRRRWRLK